MGFDDFGSPRPSTQYDGATASSQSSPTSATHTITVSVKEKFSKLKTLVLKLKPNHRKPDLSKMGSAQLDGFVDEMINELRNTFTANMDDLRGRIKSARPDQSDPKYEKKMALYQELLNSVVPIIKIIQNLSGEILNELQALINQLWDDVCKNNGQGIDHLLEEHMSRTENRIYKSFLEPLEMLEDKLNQMKNTN